MPRPETWGTPKRFEKYAPLRRRWGLVLPAVLVAFVLLAVWVSLHQSGARSVLAPGSVTSAHAPVGTTCQQCHTAGQGVSNARCQRCHDPAAGGRLANGAHVLFGSGLPARAAAAPDLECASCHVEHRGRRARLAAVDEAQCARCHFRTFARHPEFSVLKTATVETPGLKFGHERHVQEVVKAQGLRVDVQACGQCHQRSGDRDFEPLSFDRHCASCHAKAGSVGTADPVPLTDVVDLEGFRAAYPAAAATLRPEDFETARGKVARSFVRHRDAWVLFNLQKLRAEVDPEGLAAERALLLARVARLERRLAAATPVASLDPDVLKVRADGLRREIQGVEERLAAQAEAAPPMAGLARLTEVFGALASDPDSGAEVQRAAEAAGAEGPAAPLPREEFEERRRELLALLEAVEGADASLKPRVEDLRRRLVALSPGDSAATLMVRVRDQRRAALQRLEDEMRLRAEGVGPPRESLLDAERRSIERSLAEARSQLAALPVPAAEPAVGEEAQRRRETADVLGASCAKCHLLSAGQLARVTAARPVLTHATFVHEPHVLQVECAKCHAGIERSRQSAELHLQGVQSCRECHRTFGATQDCQSCHRYHPPAQP